MVCSLLRQKILNQARAVKTVRTWFLEIALVCASVCVCLCVCVSAPKGINNDNESCS